MSHNHLARSTALASRGLDALGRCLRGAADWIFGYDFFVSYSHDDGLNYPRLLRTRLEQAGFRVFLDQTDYVAGIDLQRETRRQVSKSRKLIVVGRPVALRSTWVRREVDVAVAQGKTPLVIDVNHSVENAGSESGLAKMAIESEWLRLREFIPENDGDPSTNTIAELVRGFQHTRQETKRIRVLAGVAGMLAVLAFGATWSALEARRQRSLTERNFQAAKQAADGLVFDIAQGLRNVQGLRADSVQKILGRAETTFDKLLENDPTNPSLRRSKATMLGEFSVTFLTVGDIDRAARSAADGVAIAEGLVAQDPKNDGDRRDLARLLQKLADSETEKGRFDDARALHERALAIRKDLAAAAPEDQEAARDVTASLARLAEIAETLGQYPRALDLLREVLERRERLARANPRMRRDLTVAHVKVGDVHLAEGDVGGAIASFDAAIQIARQLADEDPTSALQRRDLAVNLQRQGNAAVKGKNGPLAITAYSECRAIFVALAESDRSNLEWAQDVVITDFKLGQASVLTGDQPAAIRWFEGSLQRRRELLKTSPDNDQLARDIAENLVELAEVSPVTSRGPLLDEATLIIDRLRSGGAAGPEQDGWLLRIGRMRQISASGNVQIGSSVLTQ